MGVFLILWTGFWTFIGGALPLHAQEVIHIHEGNRNPMALVVSDFSGSQGQKITKILQENLVSSGLFFTLQSCPKPYENPTQPQDLKMWKQKGAQILITGNVETTAQGLYTQLHIFDVIQNKILTSVYGTHADSRRLAHDLSNKVYETLTGLPGYFTSHILYTTAAVGNKPQRVAMMDYDGHNHKFLSPDSFMAIVPRLSPSQRYVAFVSYVTKPAHIFVIDLETQVTKPLLPPHPQIMTYAPSFTPKGDLLFAMARGRGSSLWFYDTQKQKARPLTPHRQHIIDTSPSADPWGENLVFNSDRSGSAQLYILSLKDNHVRPLTMGPGQYFACSWSPDGQWIAFVKQWQKEFFLGIIRPDGTQERLLVSDDIIDTPSWSPDSRMIAFAAQSKRGETLELYKIHRNGQGLMPLSRQGSHPCWK